MVTRETKPVAREKENIIGKEGRKRLPTSQLIIYGIRFRGEAICPELVSIRSNMLMGTLFDNTRSECP